METIYNKNSIAHVIGNCICYVQFQPNTYLTINDFIEGYNSCRKLNKGGKHKILIEMLPLSSVNLDPSEYKVNYANHTQAEAIVVHTLAQRLIFNFHIKMSKPLHPIKLFRTKAEALIWLDKYK